MTKILTNLAILAMCSSVGAVLDFSNTSNISKAKSAPLVCCNVNFTKLDHLILAEMILNICKTLAKVSKIIIQKIGHHALTLKLVYCLLLILKGHGNLELYIYNDQVLNKYLKSFYHRIKKKMVDDTNLSIFCPVYQYK